MNGNFPPHIVIDTSAILKWYLDEKDSQQALFWHQAIFDGQTIGIIPEYLFYEAANVLINRYKIKIDDVSDILDDLIGIGLEIIPLKSLRLNNVIALASRHQLSTYDAIYLETANIFACRLLTADRTLLQRLPLLTQSLSV